MITFTSLIDQVRDDFPITAARDHREPWLTACPYHYQSQTTVQRCPGIQSLIKRGWIVPAHCDITIETWGDPQQFSWSSSIDQQSLLGGVMGPVVSHHHRSQLLAHYQPPRACLDTIVKIQTPWRVSIPRGWVLVMAPLCYSEESRYTCAEGILRGDQWINPQLFWHVMSDRTVISAGTPLCRLWIMPDSDPDWQISVDNSSL